MSMYLYAGLNGSTFRDEGTAAMLVALMTVLYVLYLGFAVACYILQSLGLYTVGKRRGVPLYGFAWVPIGSMWLLGRIADRYNEKVKGRKTHLSVWILVLSIMGFLLGVVSAILSGFAAIFLRNGNDNPAVTAVATLSVILFLITLCVAVPLAVLEYVAYYKYYKSCRPERATVYTVLSVLFAVTIPFFVYACKDRDGGMPGPVDSTAEPTPEALPEPGSAPTESETP